MIYELENSEKVKPYFNKNISWIERNPLKVARIGFFLMLGLNLFLLLK